MEGDDPVVIVGSTNWTAAGAYDNDENTLIIHDRELARAYYAEWQRLWATVSPERVCKVVRVYVPVVARDYGVRVPHAEYRNTGSQLAQQLRRQQHLMPGHS